MSIMPERFNSTSAPRFVYPANANGPIDAAVQNTLAFASARPRQEHRGECCTLADRAADEQIAMLLEEIEELRRRLDEENA